MISGFAMDPELFFVGRDAIPPIHSYGGDIPHHIAELRKDFKRGYTPQIQMIEMLEVRLIGTFDIRCDGKAVALSSRVAQSLFAYLILTAGKAHRREKLAGMFWPDATEAKARAYLRNELWRIRKALPSSEFLLSDDVGIIFDPAAAYWLDAKLLDDLIDNSPPEDLMAALSTCQGEYLPGFYDEWIVLEREHFRAIYEQKMALLLHLLEDEKRWQEILVWAERWISQGQGPEEAYRYIMIAYDAIGDRAKVTSTYRRCVQALRELDLEPSEETRALAFKRNSRLNIPIPLTSFIGRDQERQEIAELLSKSRLVTLTGSGGVGKTRLAIQVVADVLELFPDGIWFLDLAPLSDSELVPYALANLLGLRESREIPLTEQLINYFRTRIAMVIFDNCEHLIESCTQLVHSLITSCARLSILATSREALRISGEIPYRVPSLEIPRSDIKSATDALAKIESVRLFVQRASVASPGFGIRLQNAHVIAQICQRLDGIPLAIELAAARTNMLEIEQILKRLDDCFSLLTGGSRSAMPRHQTLRAMIEWSYDLLSEQERLLFRRLAIFSGGWTLEAAEEVCSGSDIESSDVLDSLSQLVSKSLVFVETVEAKTRYHRLETIRQFAREKLLETAEAIRLHDRHLAYFLKKAEEIEPYLMGAEQSAWMDYLDLELDNIRLALEWSISTKRGDEALRLFGTLGWYWFIRCHFREGEEWFRRAFELKAIASKSAQAKALRSAAFLYYAKDDFSASISVHRESLALYRELADQKGISTTLQFLAVVESARENRIQARPLFEESLRISRHINNKSAIPRVLIHMAEYSLMDGDYATAWRYYEESLEICREIQEGHLMMVVLGTMGSAALKQKNTLQARKYYAEMLEIALKLKNKRTIAETLLGFAEILCVEGRYSESTQLQGFAETLFNESDSLTGSHLAGIHRSAEVPKKHLGKDSYQKEFDTGRRLKLEQAVDIARKQQA